MTSYARTPVLAVVDSRNMFHQTEEATGFRVRPTVRGVMNALEDFGLDALEVHIGLALPRSKDRKTLDRAGRENSQYKAEIEAFPQGSVLLGELHFRDDRGRPDVEEKQVDVACAVDICRHATRMAQHDSPFKAIVVMSQDTDLTPALRYADEVGAPLIVAAASRVRWRGVPHIHLPERSFRKMAELSEPLAGHALRREVAVAANGTDFWDEFTVIRDDPTRQRIIVRSGSGLVGVTKAEHLPSTKAGSTTRLRIAGVDFGRRRTGFPLVICTAKGVHPGHDHRDAYEVREVRRRKSPERIQLTKPVFGKTVLDYPPGGLSSGSQVLLDCSEAARPLVVGPLDLPASRELTQAAPLCVRPVKQLTATTTLAATDAGGRVIVAHSANGVPTTGRRYAAVLVDSGGSGAVVQLVSAALP